MIMIYCGDDDFLENLNCECHPATVLSRLKLLPLVAESSPSSSKTSTDNGSGIRNYSRRRGVQWKLVTYITTTGGLEDGFKHLIVK